MAGQGNPFFKSYEDAVEWLGDKVVASYEAREVGEPAAAAPPHSVDERLVQCIWHDGLLVGRPLSTVSGKTLLIAEPGDWNHQAGPDFLRSEIVVNGRRIKGDIEIHVRSSDWTAHGHDRNFEYNSVVLHAFLEQDDKQRYDFRHNGEPIERLCLKPYLETDLETIRQTLSLDEYPMGAPERRGRCHETIVSLEPTRLAEILDLAGDRRLEEKAARFESQMSGESLDQVFYQALLTSLGHKSGKTLYFLLAKRTPIAELADYAADYPPAERPRLIEAILCHVANLVPRGANIEPLDEPTQAYLDSLNRYWSRVAGYFADRIIPPTRRWYGAIRPVNFPCRRLAGVALIIGPRLERGLVRSLLDLFWESIPPQPDRKSVRRMADKLARILSVKEEHYWSRRYVWGGKIAAHPQSLIGENQARSLLFNAILPIALLWARRQGDKEREAKVFALWRNFPRLPENQVVRLMRQRLFGDDKRLVGLLATEHRNQALFQIFNDCCNNRMTDCSQCAFFAAARRP